MEITLQKTVTFLLFILIGFFLKLKFKKKSELDGIKKIILNLALPATIFIALMGIEVNADLIFLPLLAVSLNMALFWGFPLLMPLLGLERHDPKYRTARLLVPSLAPGLSCFPFVLEYLGDNYLAKAAMADLGNKAFVLVFLYVVAMNWHYRKQDVALKKMGSRIKSLVVTMVSEPVNLMICLALLLVSLGFTIGALPFFIGDAMNRLSMMMTPLVLLFIGLAVSIKKKQLATLLSLLLLRSGTVSFLGGLFILVAGLTVQKDILLVLAFGLSACSFWPFAHISAVGLQEETLDKGNRTFDYNFAINLLALSFPLSILMVLGLFSSGTLFSNAASVFLLSGVLISLGLVPYLIKKVFVLRARSSEEKIRWIRTRITAMENPWQPTTDEPQ